MNPRPRLKRLLQLAERPLGGLLCSVAEPSFVETCGLVGFDYLIIDLEHSSIGDAQFVSAVRAADAVGLPLLARLSIEELHRVGHLLDGGADGFVFARVRSAGEIEAIIEATHFPPVGRRGAGPARTNSHGASDTAAWVTDENDGIFVGLLIETRGAVEAADLIASHPEIDALLVGTRDLSVDLGIPGEMSHPGVTDAVARTRKLCADNGKWFGSMVRDLALAESETHEQLRLVALSAALQPTVGLLRGKSAAHA